MQIGEFAYKESRGQIGGVKDPKGVYYVIDGHHRMAAAMELYEEDNNSHPVQELLNLGRWTDVERAPIDARPLPARDWWGSFRNWIGW